MTTQNNLTNLSNLCNVNNVSNTNKKAPAKRRGKRADHEGSIYYWEAKKLWVASIRLGQNPKTGKEVRKRKYAHSQQEALAALSALKEKYTDAIQAEADHMTTGQWIETWLNLYVVPRVRASTFNLYHGLMHKYAIPQIGHIPLSKLTELDIQAVIFGPLRNKYRSACMFRVLMMALLKKAVRARLLKYNPAVDLELPPKPPKKRFCKPSPDDWKTLIEYPKTPFYFWRWFILTEYVTGARLGELLALKWEDVNIVRDRSGQITSGTLHIQRALYSGLKKDSEKNSPLFIGGTKTPQGNRVLPLPVDFCYELQHYHKVQLEHRMLVPDWQENGFIFTRIDGRPVRPNTVSCYFAWLRHKLGIKSTFHMLRHDMASRMKNSSHFDLKDIQAQLGHASIKITMDIYTHLDEETQQNKVGQWLEENLTSLLDKPAEKQKNS